MDSIDSEIIKHLQKNGRESFVNIAKKLNMTEGAIRHRVGKMLDKGIIKFSVISETNMKAIITINIANHIPTSNIANKIRDIGTGQVYETSGINDIICIVEADTLTEINNIVEHIRNIDGVVDTITALVLK